MRGASVALADAMRCALRRAPHLPRPQARAGGRGPRGEDRAVVPGRAAALRRQLRPGARPCGHRLLLPSPARCPPYTPAPCNRPCTPRVRPACPLRVRPPQSVRVLNNRTWQPLAEFRHGDNPGPSAFVYREEEDVVREDTRIRPERYSRMGRLPVRIPRER